MQTIILIIGGIYIILIILGLIVAAAQIAKTFDSIAEIWDTANNVVAFIFLALPAFAFFGVRKAVAVTRKCLNWVRSKERIANPFQK